MPPRDPASSTTPAPVLLGALLVVGLAVVLLGSRVHSDWRARRPAPAAPSFDVGPLAEVRSVSAAQEDTPSRRATPPPPAAWTSGAHPLRPGAPGTAAAPLAPLGAITSEPAVSRDTTARRSTAPERVRPAWSSGAHPVRHGREAATVREAEPLPAEPALSVAAALPSPPPRVPGADAIPWTSRSHPVRVPPPIAEPVAARGAEEAPGVGETPPAQGPEPPPAPEAAPFPAAPRRTWTGARNILRGDTARRQVLLSFDGGSGSNAAREVLDVLEREGVRTTLFLTGEFIRAHPDLARLALARGHEVGNHTDTHLHLTTWETNRRHDTRPGVDRAGFLGQLEATRRAFLAATGEELAPFWRAPYGEVNRTILGWAEGAGYLHVGWTRGLDSMDWVADPSAANYRTPAQFLALLRRQAALDARGLNGAIILMHLHSERPLEQRFHRGLGEMVRWLRASGYDLVPASTLLLHGSENALRATADRLGGG